MHLVPWALAHPWPITAAAAVPLVLAAVSLGRRASVRPPAAVICAAVAAAACTAYSADTSWRFAGDHLGMTGTGERAAMFAAGELALFSTALMARQNLRTTRAPGTPGVLVWLITGVQVIPAFSESGWWGGLVRAFIGPVLAALLWHLAMGIELRHTRPGAESQALHAVLAREVRERLLSRLGLAIRDRSAEQITRDRATFRAVALAARLAEMTEVQRGGRRGRSTARRLSVAVGRAQAGSHPAQRDQLLQLLAARRHAAALATVALPSPWSAPAPVAPAPVTAPAAPGAAPAPASAPTVARAAAPAPAAPSAAPAAPRPGGPRPHHPAPTHPSHLLRRVRTRSTGSGSAAPSLEALVSRVRVDYASLLAAGDIPSLRTLRSAYGIGQTRAQRVQEALQAPAGVRP